MHPKIISLKNYNEPFINDTILGYGHFNTIHSGHIRYLNHARSKGKKLVIALIGDLKDKLDNPIYAFSQLERAEALINLEIIDKILFLEKNEVDKAVEIIRPLKLVLGREFKKTSNKEILKSIKYQIDNNKEIIFHAGEIHYASTQLLNESEDKLKTSKIRDFQIACKRQSISLQFLNESIKKWNQSELLVLGDTIIDQYSACEALGLSAEAPVVVVKELEQKNFIGGAAIVASHIKSLGAKCKFISVVGKDNNSNIVKQELEKLGIRSYLIEDESRPTTLKKRYVVENQKLFRVSRLEEKLVSSNIEDKIIELLENFAPKINGVVISDFVYGVITEKILNKIYKLKEKYNFKLFGDIQCSSQIGFVTKFRNFTLLCPNEREARIAMQDNETGLELLSQNLLNITNSERLIMKLGSEGFLAYDRKSDNSLLSQPFPALSANPLDVTGAGDSLLAVMATGISSGQPMMATAAIACCMASLAVESMGNKPISLEKLQKTLQDNFNS